MNNRKKRKRICLLLTVAMLMELWIPFGFSFAADPVELNIGSGDIVISQDGDYVIIGSGTTENIITIGDGVTASITLRDVTIETTKVDNDDVGLHAMSIGGGATVALTLEGENTLSAYGAGIGLADGAKLTIDAADPVDPTDEIPSLTALCAEDGLPFFPGIGNGSYEENLSSDTVITINGGRIVATGGDYGGAGIGGSYEKTGGSIVINGGSITAKALDSPYDIGDGRYNDTPNPPIVINGGSVEGTLQGTPVGGPTNSQLTKVTVTVPSGKEGDTFVFTGLTGETWAAKPNAKGEFYLYLPLNPASPGKIGADDLKGNNYQGAIKADGSGYAAQLVLNNNNCNCESPNAKVTFEDSAVTVNKLIGYKTVSLEAIFEKSAACPDSAENHIPDWTFEILGDVAVSDAKIEGNQLTVYYGAADGSGIESFEIKATALVNLKEFSATATFAVERQDDLQFDLALGDININGTTISQGSSVYNDVSLDEPIFIMSSETPTDHVITVSKGRTGVVTLSNLQMQCSSGNGNKYRISVDLDQKITFELEGKSILSDVNQSGSHLPVIRIADGAELVFQGSGSLTATGNSAPAVSTSAAGKMGTLTIENGDITLVGGRGCSAVSNGVEIASSPTTPKGDVILRGGLLSAKAGEETDVSGALNDINANMTIDGGSLLIADKGLATEPVNSQGARVYPVNLSMEGQSGKAAIFYAVDLGLLGPDEGKTSFIPSFLDGAGQLHLYLPVTEKDANGVAPWQRISAYLTAEGGADPTYYYRRLLVSTDETANEGTLVSNPSASITNFFIPIQIKCVPDEKNRSFDVTIPTGAGFNLTPIVDTQGNSPSDVVEYIPKGAVDFSNADTTPVEYAVIADDGSRIVYTVTLTSGEMEEGDMTELNIAAGDIIMQDDDTILYAGAPIPKNVNGYRIVGTSADHRIVIGNISAPIVFQNVNMNRPSLTGTDSAGKAPLYITGSDVTIQLDGTNSITGASGVGTNAADAALWVDSGASVTFIGPNEDAFPDDAAKGIFHPEGILNLIGGDENGVSQGSSAVSGTGSFVISGGSIFLTDGSGATAGAGLQPKNSAGEALYPLELTVQPAAAGATVIYCDSRESTLGRRLLANSDSVISVYRPAGTYETVVQLEDDVKLLKHYGEKAVTLPVKAGDSTKAAVVTAGLPQVTKITFEDPKTSQATEISFVLEGNFLGGEQLAAKIVLSAAGGVSTQFPEGNTVTGAAIRSNKGIWSLNLDIPANKDVDSNYIYHLTAMADGEVQTAADTDLTMWKRLAITSFTVGDVQLTEAVIQMNDEGTQGTVKIDVPYDVPSYSYQTVFTHNGKFAIPKSGGQAQSFTEANNFTNRYMIYAYYEDEDPLDPYFDGSEDTVTYQVTVKPQPTPVITSVEFEQPVTNLGGPVDITLHGENLASLRQALTQQGREIRITVGSNTVAVTAPQGGWPAGEGQNVDDMLWKATVNVPRNSSAVQAEEYVIQVSVNGVVQTLTGEDTIIVPGELEKNTAIQTFCFAGVQLGETVIDHTSYGQPGTVAINVPWRTDLTDLTPDIVLQNPMAQCTPASGVSQDFTDPVTYTVVSQDGTVTKEYIVTVTRVANENQMDPHIQSFDFGDVQWGATEIDHTVDGQPGTITVGVPWDTDRTNLVPNIVLRNDRATCTPATGMPQDFTDPVTYTIVSEDRRHTKDYIVTVKRVPTNGEDDATIHSFDLENMVSSQVTHPSGQAGSVGEINVVMPGGTNVTALAPVISLGNDRTVVSPASGEAQDFTEPVRYTVTAVDGTVYYYDVTVEVKKKKKQDTPVIKTNTVGSYDSFMTGRKNGTFGPDDNMTRAEAAALLANMLGYSEESGSSDAQALQTKRAASAAKRFADVKADAWYAPYVDFICEKGIAEGYHNSFRPAANLTRMEYSSMLSKLLDVQGETVLNAAEGKNVESKEPEETEKSVEFNDISDLWGESVIRKLGAMGIVSGFEDHTFRPEKQITRAEAAVMSLRVFNRPNSQEVYDALQAAGSPFSDVTETHWAYYGILHAVYDYEITEVSTKVNRKTTVEQKVTVKNKNEE